MKKININYTLLSMVVSILLCYGLFFSQHTVVVLDPISKSLFLVITLCSNYYYLSFPVGFYHKYFHGFKKYIVLLLTMLAVFCFIGQPLFLSELSFQITKPNLLYYLLAVSWLLPIMISLVYIIDIWMLKSAKNIDKDVKLRFILFLIFTVGWTLILIAFFPGTLTADSLDQWLQAIGMREINQYHPAIMSVMMRFVSFVWKSPSLFIFLQIVFFAYVLSTFLSFLHQHGLSKKWIYIISAILLCLPTNYLMTISLWKDIIFTIALLWMTYYFLRLSIPEEKVFHKFIDILGFVVCFILVSLFRYNGVGPLLFGLVYLFYLFYKRREKIYLCMPFIIMITLYLVNGPFMTLCGVSKDGSLGGTSYSPLTNLVVHSTGAVLQVTEDVPKFTETVAEKYGSMELLKENYSPYNIDTYGFNVKFNLYQKKLGKKATISTVEAFKAYLQLLVKYPNIVIKERLDGADILWNMTQPEASFNHRYGSGIWLPNNLNKKELNALHKMDYRINAKETSYQNDNIVVNGIINMVNRMSNIYVLDNILFRTGIYIILLFVLMFVLCNNNALIWPMYIPLVGNTATWVILLNYQVYRYVWYIQIITIFILLSTVVFGNKSKLEKKSTIKSKKKEGKRK